QQSTCSWTQRSMPVRLRQDSNAATGRRTSRCIKLGQPKFALLPAVPTQALRQACNGLLSCDRFNSLTKRGFAFHFEVVIGAGKSDYAASADAQPNHPITAQRVNVDRKCAFDSRPAAASSAAKSAHLAAQLIRVACRQP